ASLLLAIPFWYFAGHAAYHFRRRHFADLAERSKPLIAAIRSFEKDRGAAPPSLEALVPDYIAVVPTTGLEAYPDYLYFGKERAGSWFGNPWVLQVSASEGALDFDYFYYLPLQNYPSSQPDGNPERIGDWVYLHE